MTDTSVDTFDLPVGVHPTDARQHPSRHASAPVPHDTPQQVPRGHAAWSTPNRRAMPVFQRLADDFATGVYVANTTREGGTIKVVGRRKGRTRLTLWVPSSYFPGGQAPAVVTPFGVIVSEDEGKAQQGEGVPLFVGDSMDVSSEASVWASVQPGQTIGVVAWIDCWDAEALGSET